MKVVSLFSGCGGLDLGIRGGFTSLSEKYPRNNFRIIFSNDNDDDAVSSYCDSRNEDYLKSNHMVKGDIRSIATDAIPNFDILAAGFPCQPFSNAGSRKGINDDDGRGTLFEECERVLSAPEQNGGEKPIAFIFENVKGILSSKMNDGTTVPEEICRRMLKLGCFKY